MRASNVVDAAAVAASSEARRRDRVRLAIVALVFALLTALVFGPALRAPFDSDDGPAIASNLSIRQLWPLSVPLSPPPLGTPVSGRPIANLSFAIDYAINRAFDVTQSPQHGTSETVAYHATNMVLHVLVALLLFAIVRRTIRSGRVPEEWRASGERIAFLVATLWLVHPIQTEAVDYLSQRTELLVSLFYLATLYAVGRAWLREDGETGSRTTTRWLVAGTIACALGMGTKEVMLTAPFVVLLYDRAFISTTWRALISGGARKVFYAALFATIAISLALIAQGARSKTVGFDVGITWYEYFYTQCWAIARYLRLIVWPSGLTYSYGRSAVHGVEGIPGALLLVALGVATIFAWTRERWLWLGFVGAFFFLVLAPSSSVVPIVTEVAAERRVYLASAAAILAIVVGCEALWRTLVAQERVSAQLAAKSGRIAAGVCALLVVSLGAVTFNRSAMYRDPGLLWRDVAQKRPGDARAILAVAVADLMHTPPRAADADSVLGRAIVIDSTLVAARVYRAGIAINQARLSDAETLLVHALKIAPLDSGATDKLGQLLLAQNRVTEAIPYLEKVAGVFPSVDAYKNLGLAYLVANELDSAVVPLEAARRMDPSNIDVLRSLGGAYIESGRGAQAIPVLTRASELDPQSPDLAAMTSLAYAEAHDVDGASRFGAAAVASGRNDAAINLFVGRAYQLIGRLPDAVQLFSHAASLAPESPEPPTRLATVLAQMGRRGEALKILKKIVAAAPGYRPAWAAYERITRG